MSNCFAYDFGRCSILKVRRCCGPCKFYKTEEQLRSDREEASDRLDSLPLYQQKEIREKYYNGTNWK